ncbi:MAG: hypothetical protein MMC33_010433 [Icmadophila ericetorum]|nr:hypothetical protein [Icmadophila ericetorum]
MAVRKMPDWDAVQIKTLGIAAEHQGRYLVPTLQEHYVDGIAWTRIGSREMALADITARDLNDWHWYKGVIPETEVEESVRKLVEWDLRRKNQIKFSGIGCEDSLPLSPALNLTPQTYQGYIEAPESPLESSRMYILEKLSLTLHAVSSNLWRRLQVLFKTLIENTISSEKSRSLSYMEDAVQPSATALVTLEQSTYTSPSSREISYSIPPAPRPISPFLAPPPFLETPPPSPTLTPENNWWV